MEKKVNELQLEIDLTRWFLEGAFISAVLFAVVYIPFFKWRETVTGRATTVLVLAIAGALLHSVLVAWGLISVSVAKNAKPIQGGIEDQFFTWLSIVSVGAAGLAILMLTWQAAHYMLADTGNKFLRWMFHIR